MTSVISYKVYDIGALTTSLGTLTQWHSEQSTDTLNEVGHGTISLQNDDSQLSLLTHGRVVRKYVDSTAAFQWIIDHKTHQALDLSEEVAHITKVEGDGIAQVMNRAVVTPARGYGKTPWGPSRTFSFASPQYSPTAAWTGATELMLQSAASTYYQGLPTGWPDPNAVWITTSVDTSTAGHVGSWYVIGDHTFSNDTEVVLFMAADNKADVYFDGFALTTFGTEVGFNETHRATVFVTAGQHRIAAKISNFVDGGSDPGLGMGSLLGGNPTAFLCSCYEVGGDGQIGGLAIHTDFEWSVLAYPATAPGMTVPQVMGLLIDEAQTDGLIPQVVKNFTDTTFSDASSASTYESITLKVGDDLLTVLRSFSGAYCDWKFAPDSATLSMYPLGALGRTSSQSSYAVGTNLQTLKHDSIDVGTDALMVTWSGGQFRYPSSGGSRMAPFSAGNARTLAEATTLATQQLALLGGTRTAFQATIECAGTSDQPYTRWTCGDVVTVPDDTGTGSSQRVIQIVGTTDPEGNPIWTPTFRDVLLDIGSRVALNIKRMANGTLGGYSTVASPAGTPPPFGSKIDQSQLTFSVPDPITTGSSLKDDFVSASGNLYSVTAILKTTASTDTTFEYQVDGTDVLNGQGKVAANAKQTTTYVDLGSSHFTKWLQGHKSVLTLNITAVGTNAAGLVVKGEVL